MHTGLYSREQRVLAVDLQTALPLPGVGVPGFRSVDAGKRLSAKQNLNSQQRPEAQREIVSYPDVLGAVLSQKAAILYEVNDAAAGMSR
jgi:hypothetical protein